MQGCQRDHLKHLNANGMDMCLGPPNHTLLKGIDFFGPSSHRLTLAVNTGTPEMHQKRDVCKWDGLQEWGQTNCASKRAAWMHSQEFSG